MTDTDADSEWQKAKPGLAQGRHSRAALVTKSHNSFHASTVVYGVGQKLVDRGDSTSSNNTKTLARVLGCCSKLLTRHFGPAQLFNKSPVVSLPLAPSSYHPPLSFWWVLFFKRLEKWNHSMGVEIYSKRSKEQENSWWVRGKDNKTPD